jgi:hypothetical protein
MLKMGVGDVLYFQVLNEGLEVLERLPAFDGKRCPGVSSRSGAPFQ